MTMWVNKIIFQVAKIRDFILVRGKLLPVNGFVLEKRVDTAPKSELEIKIKTG